MMYPSRGRARLGIFVPFTNTNLEPDMTLLRPDGVSLHFARLGGYDEDEIPDEAQMAGLGSSNIDAEIDLLLGAKPDVVIYGCTSATLAHGPAFDRNLAATITARSGAHTVTAAGAIVHAIRALGSTKIGFASPYVPSLNDKAIDFLANEGIKTLARADFDGRLGNEGQGALEPSDVLALGQRADGPDVQAIVLSCTDMRAVEIIPKLETITGKPGVTSNQAIMFQAMQLLGLQDAFVGFGRLSERFGQ